MPKCEHKIHRTGMTHRETLDKIKVFRIHHKTFWGKFGVNTVSVCPKCEEVIYYHCDINRTISMCVENRDMFNYEWD